MDGVCEDGSKVNLVNDCFDEVRLVFSLSFFTSFDILDQIIKVEAETSGPKKRGVELCKHQHRFESESTKCGFCY